MNDTNTCFRKQNLVKRVKKFRFNDVPSLVRLITVTVS